MRPPSKRYAPGPGPASELAERALRVLRHVEFYDRWGSNFEGLPTYPWGAAPKGYATYRQLRRMGLRPGGQGIQAQVVWWHGGRRSSNGRSCRERRVAYLYLIDKAVPGSADDAGEVGIAGLCAASADDLPELRSYSALLHLEAAR